MSFDTDYQQHINESVNDFIKKIEFIDIGDALSEGNDPLASQLTEAVRANDQLQIGKCVMGLIKEYYTHVFMLDESKEDYVSKAKADAKRFLEMETVARGFADQCPV